MPKRRSLARNGRREVMFAIDRSDFIKILIILIVGGLIINISLDQYCRQKGSTYTAYITSLKRSDVIDPNRWMEYIPSRSGTNFFRPSYVVSYKFKDESGIIHTDYVHKREYDFEKPEEKYKPGSTIEVKYLSTLLWSCPISYK